jgi:hypothetical protein
MFASLQDGKLSGTYWLQNGRVIFSEPPWDSSVLISLVYHQTAGDSSSSFSAIRRRFKMFDSSRDS